MVCVPCIILPVILAIYLKFIQPFIMRFVPDSWKARIDSILYPTCPVAAPKSQPKANETTPTISEQPPAECPCDSKKDQ
ncbi:UPF0729 protein F18A11.3 [Aphelenchoides avenae]|nr:UPF0729 protein F18A11.3 [Aphelenchus avenae]